MSSSNRSRNRPSSSSRNYTSSHNTASAASSTNQSSRPATNAWARPLQQNKIRAHNTTENSFQRSIPSRSSISTTSVVTNPPPGLSRSSVNVPSSSSGILNNLRERFLLLNQALIGQRVTVTLTSGDVLEGIFHTFTPFREGENKNKYVFKSCTFIKTSEPKEEGSTVILKCEKVRDVIVKSMRLEGGAHKGGNGSLVTDTDISGGRGPNGMQSLNGKRNKDGLDDLIAAGSAWMSGASENGVGGLSSRADALKSGGSSTSNASGLKGSIGQWDQFSENEKLFNVKATFDEDVYTTPLDRKSLDATQIEQAEKMAIEIEGSTSSNMHVAEERGHKIENDYDEEDLYSGVIRKETPTSSSSNGVWGKKGALVEATKKKSEEEANENKVSPPIKKNYAAVAAAAPVFSGTTKNIKTKSSGLAEETLPPNNRETDSDAVADNTPPTPAIATPNEPAEHKSNGEIQKENMSQPEEKIKISDGDEVDVKDTSTFKETSSTKENETSNVSTTESQNASTKTTETSSNTEKEKNEQEKPKKPSSKLNANAKSFSFNPSAKTFTPGGNLSTSSSQHSAALQHPSMDDGYTVGMMGYAPHPQHYMAQAHVQPGMMPMMSAGGIRYPAPGPYAQYPMQQHPISQISNQPLPQSTQESTSGFDGTTSTTSSTESAAEQPQPSHTPAQNIQQHPYGVPNYYPTPGTHQAQATMIHRATPHMGGGYPSHHTIPQQFPMHGGTAAPHYRTMYQPHLPQHTIPPGGHVSQPMISGGYYNQLNAGTGTSGTGGMHGYHPQYANMGGVGSNMNDDSEHSFRGGRGRGNGGRGRKSGRKNGRGGNGGRGGGYHHNSNGYQGASQQPENPSSGEEAVKGEEKDVQDDRIEIGGTDEST